MDLTDCAHPPARPPTPSPLAKWEQELLPHIIRAESNLLRLPCFALSTKGLKTLDGIECTGKITRDGQTHQFRFRATRNTATLYPGPLARAAHFAFLSIVTKQGFPFENPVTWKWRDLCRRMRIAYGTYAIRGLKEAIKATSMLGIETDFAIYAKDQGKPICTRQEALHLYDRVTFIGAKLPDGTTADQNQIWLSEWYLNNLNAMFTAPLDYSLWRYLDEQSPIASRLYEFLLLNFYSGSPVLRINYETLARFLPVRPEKYRSQAKQQLQAAFELLTNIKVIQGAVWGDSKDGLAQLSIYRGDLLTAPADKNQGMLPFMEEDFVSPIEVKELRNLKPPEWEIVTNFYKLWNGDERVRPTKKELAQASELLAVHGPAKTKGIISLAIKRMKVKFPDAKTFGAIARYFPDALQDYERDQRLEERRKKEKIQKQQEQQEYIRKKAEEAKVRALWQTLPEAEQEAIRTQVAAKYPHVARFPRILEQSCLSELASRQNTSPSPSV